MKGYFKTAVLEGTFSMTFKFGKLITQLTSLQCGAHVIKKQNKTHVLERSSHFNFWF